MGRNPCCSKDQGLNRGAWTAEEDRALTDYIATHGEGRWRDIPTKSGLKRCGKSCRLRWLNYLRPDIKRGNISPDEEELIIRLHKLLGNRWSLIAGRLPGRTDNEIKNYWNTILAKRVMQGNNSINPCSRNMNSCINQTDTTTECLKDKIILEDQNTINKLPDQDYSLRTSAINHQLISSGYEEDNPSNMDFMLDFDLGELNLWDILTSDGSSNVMYPL